jgi:hypothetical protein
MILPYFIWRSSNPAGPGFLVKPQINLPPSTKEAITMASAWTTFIANDDNTSLWRELHRLTKAHPLTRQLTGTRSGANTGRYLTTEDITQDLYLLLLRKDRFEYYLSAGMSNPEIERQILQVELTNLLIQWIRKRYPESYRISRRVIGALRSKLEFRQFTRPAEKIGRRLSAAHTMYGLSSWPNTKPTRDSATFELLVAGIPTRSRNLRKAGCSGTTDLIISTKELVALLIDILTIIDSPASVRTLQQLAIGRLSAQNVAMTSLDSADDAVRQQLARVSVVSTPTAERQLIEIEEEGIARGAASQLLQQVSDLAQLNPVRAERFFWVLWHFYLDPTEPTQLTVAERLGISDSSIGNYRRQIGILLGKLQFPQTQLVAFRKELERLLSLRLAE